MKRIILLVLLFAAIKVAGQTTGYLRFDTVRIMKQGGTCELYIINKTKDSLGILTNVGGGLTRFIKPKKLNDTTIVVGLDTLIIPGRPGTGTSTILNNIGAGFRWVATPSGNIKTAAAGDGILIDSTTNANALTIKRDTTGVNGTVTRSEIRNALYNKKNLQRHLGTLFDDNTWTTIDNLTVNGATASVVSNKIDISGGAGDYTETLDVPGGTLLEHWKITGKFKATEKSSTSYGFGVGIRSYNSYATLNSAARFDATSTGNGILSLNNSGLDKIVTSALGFSVNDYIVLTLERDVDLFTLTAKNVNTGATVSGTYRCDPTSSPALHNSGTFSVFSYGGTFTLDSLNVTSREVKYTPLMVIGDSKTQLAGTGVTFGNRYAAQLSNYFGPTIISAGSSDRVGEVVLRTGEIIALHPLQALIAVGSNNPRSSVPDATTFADYDTLTNRLTAAGIKVYHLLPFPESFGGGELGVDQSALRAHIVATYSAADIIDVEKPLQQCASCLSTDDVHPNLAGQSVILNAIVESFKLNDVVQGVGDVAYKSQENTFTQRQIISGDFTTKAGLKINGFIAQPYGVNNIFMGDNFEYNGSAFLRLATGYSSVWYQQNGAHIFQTAPSGAAGSSFFHSTVLKLFANGHISNTDTDHGFNFGIYGTSGFIANSASPDGVVIRNDGIGEATIKFYNDHMLRSNGQYLDIESAVGHPIYMGFSTTSNAGNTVNFFNGRAVVANDGSIYAGKIHIGGTSPTARLHIVAGTATANTAPIKLTSGTNLTTPEDGAIEYDGTHYYATVGSTRYQIDQQTSGLPVLASGTYTPTLTNGANIASSTAYQCQYSRVGNVVTVSGKITIDYTSTGDSDVGVSLPIASDVGNDYEVAGSSASGYNPGFTIKGDATNNRAQFFINTGSSSSYDYFFTFTYLVL